MSAAHAHRTLGPEETRRLGNLGSIGFVTGLVIALGALILAALIGAMTGEWTRAAKSYLFAYAVILSISLGGLFFTILQHLTRAGWSVAVRRVAEGFASNLRWIWIFFIPILIATFTTDLYHWMHPVHDGYVDELLVHKAPYFFWPLHYESHVPAFWLARSAIYFIVWGVVAHFFVSNSIRQDATGDVALTHKMEWWAPLSMLAYAATQTFAALDWLMALEPHWFSTMFPVYFFAASATGFFGLFAFTVYLLNRNGRLTHEITAEHYQDLGKFLFAFGVVFWAYIAYSQYMLIWYANLPETTGWFLARTIHSWQHVSLLLLVGHFIAPFVILITRHTKRMRPFLAAAGAWMVLMHMVDLYWLTMPVVPHEELATAMNRSDLIASLTDEQLGFDLRILDLLFLIGMLALLAAGTMRQLGRASLIPERDPRLGESLAFENI